MKEANAQEKASFHIKNLLSYSIWLFVPKNLNSLKL